MPAQHRHTHTAQTDFTFQTFNREVTFAKAAMHPLSNILNLRAQFAGRINSMLKSERECENTERQEAVFRAQLLFFLNSAATVRVLQCLGGPQV